MQLEKWSVYEFFISGVEKIDDEFFIGEEENINEIFNVNFPVYHH